MTKTLSEVCSDADLRRFAICLLHSERANIDWSKAAAQYDPKVQVASFKTVTNKALKRAQEALALTGGDGANSDSNETASSKSKRDASSEDAESSPSKKQKATLKSKGKKAAAEHKKATGDQVKEESPLDDEEV